MQLVTIDRKLYKLFESDSELLHKETRPCVVVVNLVYKGGKYRFAVPIRSNISPSVPKNEYFPLPTRGTTKPKHRHGIHYAKMFPILREYQHAYHTDGNMFAKLISAVIDKNERRIVLECQDYLRRYEQGDRPLFSTDIDFLTEQLKKSLP